MPPLRMVGTLILGAGLGGCWVSMPRPDEWLRVGFRSPEQAARSFQVAIRADEPELEYRCFSADFRTRNRISKLAWREARVELRQRHPWLCKGISDARIEGPIQIAGDRAWALLETHGQWIRIAFVREDFAETWSGEMLLSDEFVSFDERTATQVGSDGRLWFQGSVALPSGESSPTAVTEMHLGREWKIDSFESVDPPREAARTRAEAPPRENPYD